MNKEISTALLKAQGAMGKLLRDSNNPHFNSTYASLAAVLDTVRGPLTDAGLVLYQSATTDEGNVLVHSALIHAEAGEAIEEVLSLPIAQRTHQALGSAITYGRRYLAMAMCGLAPDDDDANDASNAKPKTLAPRLEKPKPSPNVSRETVTAQHRQPSPTVSRETSKPQVTPDVPASDADIDFGMSSGWEELPNREESDHQYCERAALILHADDVELTDMATRLIAKCRELDKSSGDKALSIVKKDGTGSGQYGLLTGKLDRLTAPTKGHRFILSALCGRVISQENPPGWKVKELIDWLQDDNAAKANTEQALKDVWAAVKQVENVKVNA